MIHNQNDDDVYYEQERGLDFDQIDQLPESIFTEDESKSCQICLDAIEKGQSETYLFCFHSFHSGCIKEWLMKNRHCPLCKMDIKEELEKMREIGENF